MQAILDSVTNWHLEREEERRSLRSGPALIEAASRLAERLPNENLVLLTRNEESAALVGAALALRPSLSARARWEPLTLGRIRPASETDNALLIEAAQIGDGLREAISAQYPRMVVLDDCARPHQETQPIAA